MTKLSAVQLLTREVQSLRRRVISLECRVRNTETVKASTQVAAYLRSVDLSRVYVDDMANSFHMSGQTLRRRLREEGESFLRMLDDERKRRVEAELARNPAATCHVLADVAGYSDHQNLTRSFPRWFGQSLREYKSSGEERWTA